jgi:hypothetical protein
MARLAVAIPVAAEARTGILALVAMGHAPPMRITSTGLSAAVLAIASFLAGRYLAPAANANATAASPGSLTSRERAPAMAPAVSPVGAGRPTDAVASATDDDDGPAVGSGGAAGVVTTTRSATPIAAAGAAAPTCDAQLEAARAELAVLVKRREELEGKPIPPRNDVAPRFASTGLVSTFQRGFTQSGVKGQVESVDCSEHPCILFGRLDGDEGEVAKLEDSPAFAVYDDDVGVMLTWASGHGGHDDDHHQKPGTGREKPAEVSLFAFAFYAVDEEAHGEQFDRRIRTRTTEYWNASRPRE